MVTESLGQVTPLDRTAPSGRRSSPRRSRAPGRSGDRGLPPDPGAHPRRGRHGSRVLVSERIARANALADAERIGDPLDPSCSWSPPLTGAVSWQASRGRWEELERILDDPAQRRIDHLPRRLVSRGRDPLLQRSTRRSADAEHPRRTSVAAAAGTNGLRGRRRTPETSYEGPADRRPDGRGLRADDRPATRPWSSRPTSATTASTQAGRAPARGAHPRWPSARSSCCRSSSSRSPSSLARRVRRHETERAELMGAPSRPRSANAAIIAADVHDGPVQDLAGVSYALERAARPAPRRPAGHGRPAGRGGTERGAVPPPADGRPVPARPERRRAWPTRSRTSSSPSGRRAWTCRSTCNLPAGSESGTAPP